MQVFFFVDEEALEQHNAKLKKQLTQASRKRRRRSSSSSTSLGSAITAGHATPAAAAAPAGAPDDDPDDDPDAVDDAGDDEAVVLGSDAIAIIKKGLAVVCPRLPNGRFMKRTDFEWRAGWAAVLRGFVQRVKALPRYAAVKDDIVHTAIADKAHQ